VQHLGLVTRADIVDFHKRILNCVVKLQDLTRDLMLEQVHISDLPTFLHLTRLIL
jgi:hypothetical protein